MKDEIEYLKKMVEINGAACATVSDGHVIMLNKDTVKKLMDSVEDKPYAVLFVKRDDMSAGVAAPNNASLN